MLSKRMLQCVSKGQSEKWWHTNDFLECKSGSCDIGATTITGDGNVGFAEAMDFQLPVPGCGKAAERDCSTWRHSVWPFLDLFRETRSGSEHGHVLFSHRWHFAGQDPSLMSLKEH